MRVVVVVVVVVVVGDYFEVMTSKVKVNFFLHKAEFFFYLFSLFPTLTFLRGGIYHPSLPDQ